MGVFDLFSKRQKRARGEVPDVYVYNQIPDVLRAQIVHIIDDTFGVDDYGRQSENAYEIVHDALCREYGLFELKRHSLSKKEGLFNYFLEEKSLEKSIDLIELSFKVMIHVIKENYYNFNNNVRCKMNPDDAVEELNQRFKEHGVGYQFVSGEIIRVDSEYIHSEVVKPVLLMLSGPGFKGANEEFLSAHENYRNGRFKEALVDSLKSFESTMKAICKLRGLPYNPNDTAKSLIKVCLEGGVVPPYLETQLGAIRTLMESGVPTLRNKLGGHGQGADPVQAPEHMARYALHLTATTILFMVESHEGTK